MSITDLFKVKQYKTELEATVKELNSLKQLITPEMQNVITLNQEIERLNNEKDNINSSIKALLESKINIFSEINNLNSSIQSKKQEILSLDDEILVQEFGLYSPQYDFQKADEYKDRLNQIRAKQKELIKNKTAATGDTGWTVNGNAAKGRKMVSDMQKLLLRAFNSECDELIAKVKYNNIEASLKRITSSRDAISKLGTIMSVAITPQYYNLKVEELHLAFEYQTKKQEEKEALKEARAEMREAARLQKEIDEQRKKIEKEQTHYQKALITILKQLELPENQNNQDLLSKKKEYENELGNIELSLKDIDYREANQRAGYVYIISNIGAFGDNIFKIGMTRRLDPQERVDELGDASVPFNFDVHAMIFSEDAPKLENALHKAFEDRKLNMVNQRREFFNVTLDEIKEVIKANFDKTVEFIDVPDAEQYRVSLQLKNK